MSITVFGFAGSLRTESWNHKVLLACQELVPEGMTLEVTRINDLPLFNEDLEVPDRYPAAVAAFKERIAAADAILILTPEYNFSVPGVEKNAIDWGSRPYGQSAWSGKPVAIAGASPGQWGTIKCQQDLRLILHGLNMHVLAQPQVFIGKVAEKFDAAGTLTDAPTRAILTKMLAALGHWTRQVQAMQQVPRD